MNVLKRNKSNAVINDDLLVFEEFLAYQFHSLYSRVGCGAGVLRYCNKLDGFEFLSCLSPYC